LDWLASEEFRSNSVSAVLTKEGNVSEFLAGCMEKGMEFASGVHPALIGRYFRIGHMGWVRMEHADRAIEVICEVISGQ